MIQMNIPFELEDVFKKISTDFATAHTPVLYREIGILAWELRGRHSFTYFDGTFGRGGHYTVLKTLIPNLEAWAVDQDEEAILFAKQKFDEDIGKNKLSIFQSNFSRAFELLEFQNLKFDFMLLDLGVSSPQLDNANRGFSFYHDGPLDMRMDLQNEMKAETIINFWDEADLIELFKKYGEIFKPYRVVRALVHDRKSKPFQTTRELAGLIERVDGWKQKGLHPATKYFMALRLAVNNELEVVEKSVQEMVDRLKPGGRLCVITFHSLEDRIVKNGFKDLVELGRPLFKKVVIPSEVECQQNSRARSGKLRVFQRKDESG